jgi:AsmA-like C-terminal region
MAWRKWLVRGLVFSVLGLSVLAAVVYQAWTNPTAIRAQVLNHIRGRFVDRVGVSLDSAQLRLFGGIAVSELRVARTDGLERKDFLYVPSGVIFHDKERLARGVFAVRKLELHRPQLRLVRERDGRWNLSGLFAAGDPREPLPAVVVQQGTLILEESGASSDTPMLEIKDVAMTALEDPPGVVTVAGTGRTDVAGPVRFNGVAQRGAGDFTGTLDALDIPIGPELVQRIAAFYPAAADQVRYLRGLGKIQASVAYHPASSQPLTYDVVGRLSNGELNHARLPQPLEEIDASVHCVNGLIPLAHLTAHAGTAALDLTLKDITPPKKMPPDDWYDVVRELDLQVDHLAVTDDLVKQLPDSISDLQQTYRPGGLLSVTHTLRRDGPSTWRKRWLLRSEDMQAEFSHFAYKIERITGTVDFDTTSEQTTTTAVDLTGYAGPRPVTLKGTVRGPKAAAAIDLEIASDDLPLDEKLFKALPPETGQKIARQFLPARSRLRGLQAEPMGRADVRATIHREAGKDFANRYVIRFHDASVQYDVFPIPLEKVSGLLDLRTPGGWEVRDFRGVHDGGVLHLDGRSYAPPGSSVQDRIYVVIKGDEVAVDTESFKNALSPSKAEGRTALRHTMENLGVSGRMNFKAVVDESLSQPQDIDVSVAVDGCSLKPHFFPFDLNQVNGAVRYTHNQVFLTGITARHGASVLSMKKGQVTLRPGGGFQGRFNAVSGDPLAPDADFVAALPDSLRRGFKTLQLRGPLTATADVVVDAPSEPGGLVVLWWDGAVELHDVAMHLGLDMTGVEGRAACCGLYNGRRLESLAGNVLLERADLFGQPLQDMHARIEMDPGSPETLRIRDFKAGLYGGTLGGEGRVEFAAAPRYDLTVKALQIDLGQFARQNNLGADAQIKGRASAALHLSGDSADVSGLKGNGRIDVMDGKLYRLPLQLDLLKAFGLRVPDRTAFEQAHAAFAIDGPQLQVQSLDLYGNAISLRGRGTVDLDGNNLNLDFNADWGRLAQLLPDPVNDIPRAVSDQLLKIKMRGRIGDVHLEKELAPGVVEPIMKAFSQ